MSIFVSIEDREGETIGEVYELRELPARLPAKGLCLPYIRETTDSFFNYLQMPALLAELEELAAAKQPTEVSRELERLIQSGRKCADKRDRFLRFYGETSRGE